MYISRIEIDFKNRQKIKNLSHLGAYHNWVESSFPNEIAKEERLRHLWRIDELYGKQYLLIVSSEKPNVQKLNRYGVEGSAMVKDYQPFLKRLANNELMMFRVVANPTYRKNGKVYPHITINQQKNWLIQRAEKAGFLIVTDKSNNPRFDIVKRDWPILYHKRRVRLSRVTFEGMLKIINVEKFRSVLINGIGREKAYGMGMLTVIPVRKNDEK